jgi:hypothetical protein
MGGHNQPLTRHEAKRYGAEAAPNVRFAPMLSRLFANDQCLQRGDGTAVLFGIEFIDPSIVHPRDLPRKVAEAKQRVNKLKTLKDDPNK